MFRIKNISLACLYFLALSYWGIACSNRSSAPSEPADQQFDNTIIETVTDINGNVYQTVYIGNKLWMTENLRVTHYRNGDPIHYVAKDGAWGRLTEGAYCKYDNQPDIPESLGLLYNWYAVNDSRQIAPAGWHVPSDEEWRVMIEHIGGTSSAGNALKYTIGWYDDGNGSNKSGFSALPGGVRYSNGIFGGLGAGASFWSSSEISSDGAWGRWLSYVGPGIGLDDANKLDGFSIRCVRD